MARSLGPDLTWADEADDAALLTGEVDVCIGGLVDCSGGGGGDDDSGLGRSPPLANRMPIIARTTGTTMPTTHQAHLGWSGLGGSMCNRPPEAPTNG